MLAQPVRDLGQVGGLAHTVDPTKHYDVGAASLLCVRVLVCARICACVCVCVFVSVTGHRLIIKITLIFNLLCAFAKCHHSTGQKTTTDVGELCSVCRLLMSMHFHALSRTPTRPHAHTHTRGRTRARTHTHTHTHTNTHTLPHPHLRLADIQQHVCLPLVQDASEGVLKGSAHKLAHARETGQLLPLQRPVVAYTHF